MYSVLTVGGHNVIIDSACGNDREQLRIFPAQAFCQKSASQDGIPPAPRDSKLLERVVGRRDRIEQSLSFASGPLSLHRHSAPLINLDPLRPFDQVSVDDKLNRTLRVGAAEEHALVARLKLEDSGLHWETLLTYLFIEVRRSSVSSKLGTLEN